MINSRKIIAIIPARGGSKRCLRKNIREIKGVHLIGWTINQVILSSYIDKVVISSDDDEILKISKNYCDGDFIKRPNELGTDTATSFSVVKHVLKLYPEYQIGILLQPTSPLRTKQDIDLCIEKFEKKKCNSMVSISKTNLKKNNIILKNNEKKYQYFNNTSKNLDIKGSIFSLNGAIYCFEKAWLLKNKKFVDDSTDYFEMPVERSIDIDTENDMKYFKFIMET